MPMAVKSQSHTRKGPATSAGSSRRGRHEKTKEPHIVRYSREETERIGPGKTDWERVRNMTDEEIEAAIADDPDAVPAGLDWTNAELVIPLRKQPVSIRLDEDVLDFFKSSGPGYQTRINEVLRTYMRVQKAKEKVTSEG